MSKWEIFRHGHAIGVRMPSDNKTKYGAVRYVTVGGFDREDQEQMAEAERIVHMIADAPALLDALKMFTENSSVQLNYPDYCKYAEALIAKHRGES